MRSALLSILLYLTVLLANACDHCGCDAGSGILPTDNRSFLSFGYRTSIFSGYRNESVNDLRLVPFTETFERYELNAKRVWKNKWELMISIPYGRFQGTNGNFLRDDYSGIGDASIIGRVIFRSRIQCAVAHRLAIGGGVELPTGKHGFIGHDGIVNPFQQPGTGSWDALAQFQYTFRYNDWGLLSSGTGKLNASNSLSQRLPLQYSVQADVFRSLGSDSAMKVILRAGCLFEKSLATNYTGPADYIPMAGQGFVVAQATAEVYWKKLWLSVQYGHRLNDAPSGLPATRNDRFAFNIGYMF